MNNFDNAAVSGTDLPGYRKQSFAMAFGGGEIWFEHLDGLYGFTALAVEKLSADSQQFLRPSMPSLLAVNLEETVVDTRLIDAVCERLLNPRKRFTRVVFVGVDKKTGKQLQKRLSGGGFALAFIDDFEKAKEWLVREGQ